MKTTVVVKPGTTFRSIKAEAENAEPVHVPMWIPGLAGAFFGAVLATLFYAGYFG